MFGGGCLIRTLPNPNLGVGCWTQSTLPNPNLADDRRSPKPGVGLTGLQHFERRRPCTMAHPPMIGIPNPSQSNLADDRRRSAGPNPPFQSNPWLDRAATRTTSSWHDGAIKVVTVTMRGTHREAAAHRRWEGHCCADDRLTRSLPSQAKPSQAKPSQALWQGQFLQVGGKLGISS